MKKIYWPALLLLTLCGCSHTVARYDEFEKVKVQRMVGNEVKPAFLSRTVICLNAMREVRWPGPATNQTVNWVTNFTVTSVTNQTVTRSAVDQTSANTNAVATISLNLEGSDGSVDASTNVAAASSPADVSQAGLVLSSLQNESIATAPNQNIVSRTHQTVSTVSSQNTINTNNQAWIRGLNQTVTTETNWVITSLTNQTVSPVTNITVTVPDAPAVEYYVYTEIAPQDFNLAPGENLVLLVDGVRGAFAPVTPLSGWQPRRGYLTTFYRVPADVVLAIANSREVQIRIRGSAGTLERTLSQTSRRRFREFLLESAQEVESGKFTAVVAP